MKNKHVNIPVFIPHLGCPNMCVFCNQRAISGVCLFRPEMAEEEITKVLHGVNICETDCEIAFFGGSFTGIDRKLMIDLLDIAQGYVNSGAVSGIRMSTRPDYINDEIISILKRYTVSAVELGIQSFSDKVLMASKRGHSSQCSENAITSLCKEGFSVVGQMMVGLPMSTAEDEVMTAKKICELGATGSRIYPTVVFRDTELYDMTVRGQYSPLSVEEAARRSAAVLEVFIDNNVNCIRIGLCENENLHSENSYFAGPNHPSLGELVYSELYFSKIMKALQKTDTGDRERLVLSVHPGEVSKVSGHGQINKARLKEMFGYKKITIKENEEIPPYEVKIS